MNSFDAIEHLRNLPADQVIDFPGFGESGSLESYAVSVITGENPNMWAANRGRWTWTAAELAQELTDALDSDE